MTTVRTALAAITIAAVACANAAEPRVPDEYSSGLGRVYGAYHRVLAEKEVCDSSVPATRAANSRALAAWQGQHKALVEDLRRRVTAMIRLASTDEKDYARNLGKYEGAILQERQDYRDSLLKLGADELKGQCGRMAAVLKSPDADLSIVYADELEAIRKRN